MAKRQSKLRTQIIAILRQYPQSRNSDQWLTLKLWCVYFPSRIKEDAQKKKFVYLRDVLDLPREDHVKRIRAIIQNEEKRFLPTTLEVARQRQISEMEWRAYIQKQESLFDQ